MPIYEYQCTRCGERFEVRQAIGEDGSDLSCPRCRTRNPKRLVSSFFSPGSGSTEASAKSCPSCSSGVCGLPGIE
jgi:putative FmdB family regulatory protein